ncbi:MAG: ribosome maturation factor RimM [Gammaproteobacteria bacterium HGW-Gammaproteobacteria-3]|nr:MAG: ribosome maturation factor RimM [Gammaproteobacteria bacterium HGW-Gammaproteobacteria-3]
MAAQDLIEVGEISGVFGLKGLVKVFSFTEPRENILSYSPWLLQKGSLRKTLAVDGGQRQGKNIVAHLDGIDDPDAAASLKGWKIFIGRGQLPKTPDNEYYWADLIGLKVVNQNGVALGVVDYLLETGANDVLVVAGETEHLIPFVSGQAIIEVNPEEGVIVVDWDPDF